MKKIRRIVSLLLIAAFLSGTVISCASKPKKNDSDSPDIVTETGEEIDVIKKPVVKTAKQLEREQKKQQAEEKKAAEKAAKEAKAAEDKKAAEEKKAAKQQAKQEAAEQKAAELAEKNKNIAGWDDDAETKNFEVIQGIMKFKVNPSRGSFNLYIISEDGKTNPVFSSTNEYTTTSFYVRRNGRIIKLNEDLGVKTTARKLDDGFQIAYKIDSTVFVQLTFTCFNSTVGGNIDTVRISAVVKSLSAKTSDFDLKLLMDTVLGETDRHHFYTFDRNPVKTEFSSPAAKTFPWFVSKNTTGELQVIVNGYDITAPKMVALANYSTLNTKFWEPDLMTARSFDTVLSYNNSACELIWPTHKLQTNDSFKEVFYLSVANQEKTPTGYVYVSANNGGEPVEYDEEAVAASADSGVVAAKAGSRKPKASKTPSEPAADSVSETASSPEKTASQTEAASPKTAETAETPAVQASDVTKGSTKEVQTAAPVNPEVEKIKDALGNGVASGKKSAIGKDAELKKQAEEDAKKPKQKDASKPSVQTAESSVNSGNSAGNAVSDDGSNQSVPAAKETVYVEKPVTMEQLSPDYIEKLLERIAELEASGDDVDRDELLLLNAELDTILEYLQK